MNSPGVNKVRIHCIGKFALGEVIAQSSPDSRPRIAEIESAIETAWQQTSAQLGVKLFDGPMCRLESFIADKRLTLHLSRTTYKAFLGTNLANPELADKFGVAALANPVGLSAALLTADSFIMLGRRNASVAYYPQRIHPFAGTLEPTGEIDVFAEMSRELAEELGFSRGDISEIVCIGIAEDASIRQPELIFQVATSRMRAQVEQSLDTAEHNAAVAIAADKESLRQAITDPAMTPIASAAILLWGRQRFGREWFDAAARAVTLPTQ
jgi:hypothetical protein